MRPCIRPAPAIALVALLADRVIGDPEWLDRRLGHPVRWFGAAITEAERRLNRPDWSDARRRWAGVLALLPVGVPPVVLAAGVQRAVLRRVPRPVGIGLLGMLGASLVAQRSLFEHVGAVGEALDAGGVAAGRSAVGRIVGRDTAGLDRGAILRAAIESLAENFSDGVTAPLLWGAMFGLPGLVFFKLVNTADSMIGHRTPRHAAFGWAAARLDDAVNLPASRVSALLLVGSGRMRRWRDAVRIVRRDAPRHRSPNAGWPEAAMAAVLDLQLAGPRSYGGVMTVDPPMGEGRVVPEAGDLVRALRCCRRAGWLLAVPLAVSALRRGRA